jgi:mannose-6-phosphate isomerase-like protein (cupin superfamily)
MAVQLVDIEALEWQGVPDEWAGKVADGEPVRFKPFSTGARAVPGGQMIEYQAGHVEAPHSHDESEIYFVLSGDLAIGDDRVAAGMLVYIAAGTVYSPSTERGCRFLRLELDEPRR